MGKLVTICAACTYLVCCAGDVMQRLAKQALNAAKKERDGNDSFGSSQSNNTNGLNSIKIENGASAIKQEHSALNHGSTSLSPPLKKQKLSKEQTPTSPESKEASIDINTISLVSL